MLNPGSPVPACVQCSPCLLTPKKYLFMYLAYVGQDFIPQFQDQVGMLTEDRNKLLPFLIERWAFFQIVPSLLFVAKDINSALFRI